MVNPMYGGAVAPRNCDPTFSVAPSPTLANPSDPAPVHPPVRGPHPGLVRHPHLTPDDQVRLLACIEAEGGTATLDDLAAAIPDHPRPITAVLALIEAGLLRADFQAPFDANLRLWRA